MIRDLQKALKRCSKPERVCLAVVADAAHSRTELMPITWQMWTSARPRLFAFSVGAERYTRELLEREQECVIAWPGEDLVREVLLCGSTSGHRSDKLVASGLTPLPANQVGAPLIRECVVNLECTVENSLVTGDHTLFVVRVLEGYVAEDDRGLLLSVGEETGLRHLGGGSRYRFGALH